MLSESYNVIYLWLNTEVIVQVHTRNFEWYFSVHVYLCTWATYVILCTKDSQPFRHCTSLSTLKYGHPSPLGISNLSWIGVGIYVKYFIFWQKYNKEIIIMLLLNCCVWVWLVLFFISRFLFFSNALTPPL